MTAQSFSFEFSFKGSEYFGGIRPIVADHRTIYSVILETEDCSENLALVLKPSPSDLEEWEFECVDGSAPLTAYDKELLQEIGDQVSSCLTGKRRTNLNMVSDSVRL